jgi:hypothetical protein
MSARRQQNEERSILDAVTRIAPTVFDGITFIPAEPNPPDFIGESTTGLRMGLELTSWLNDQQTRESQNHERMRRNLLDLLSDERHPRPGEIPAVIMPHWNKKTVGRQDVERFIREFHGAVRMIDTAWPTLRKNHWRTLGPEDRFDYEAHEFNLRQFKTLTRYVSSIWFIERQASDSLPIERSWISILPDGGFYDPTVSILTLRAAIQNMVAHYSRDEMKIRLRRHRLHEMHLLVCADPNRFSSNTPYQTTAQMMRSPVDGLEEAAEAATANLLGISDVFASIFLFYPIAGSQWCVQIWPTIKKLSRDPTEVPFSGR